MGSSAGTRLTIIVISGCSADRLIATDRQASAHGIASTIPVHPVTDDNDHLLRGAALVRRHHPGVLHHHGAIGHLDAFRPTNGRNWGADRAHRPGQESDEHNRRDGFTELHR